MQNFDLGNVAAIWAVAALFLLIGIVGGKFKFRGTEISNNVAMPLRILSFMFAAIWFCGPFIWVQFSGSVLATPAPVIEPAPASPQGQEQAVAPTAVVLVQTVVATSAAPAQATAVPPTEAVQTGAAVPAPATDLASQAVSNESVPTADPVLKGYAATIWNHPDGYILFTRDIMGNNTYQDYNLLNVVVSEGSWTIDNSQNPPLLGLDGYHYIFQTQYGGGFNVYDSAMEGSLSFDGINFLPITLTFNP